MKRTPTFIDCEENRLHKQKARPTRILHEFVRREIHDRIMTGMYSPQSKIPSAASLSREFCVSAITVKRAVRDLQVAGELVAIAGKGTYVKRRNKIFQKLDINHLSLDNISIRFMSISREKIPRRTMESIDSPDDFMTCIRKTVWAGDSPLFYDTTYVPSKINTKIIDELQENLMHNVLEGHSIHVINTHLVVEAAPASKISEIIFNVPSGYPTLRRLYKTITSAPKITIYGVLEAPFDRLACTLDWDP
ncbi:GntR family transcriptional regulator [Paraburkholderia mimosarum]|uniref:GntR family transcriptional regulator n=1 Tax=Paraburkholderia mimosarum TaxID=312026 RepID=UPI0009DD31F5|nr:GntR family transcriptional regulator [Paraburkholderia mimosarum]